LVSGGRRAELFEELVEGAPVAAVIHREGIVVYANRAAARLVGLEDPAAGLGRPVLDWVAPQSQAVVLERSAAVLAGAPSPGPAEMTLVRADGRRIVVETTVGLVRWEDAPAVLVVLWDVTLRRRRTDRLAWAATHDPLTRLLNRRGLLDGLSNLAESRPAASQAGLLLVDIDDFKGVNDALGHAAGDRVLREVGRRLAAVGIDRDARRRGAWLAAGDGSGPGREAPARVVTDASEDPGAAGPSEESPTLVGRLGGDEFVLAWAPATLRELAEVSAEIERVLARPLATDEGPLALGASVGEALLRPGEEVDSLLLVADQAMYAAKRRRHRRVGQQPSSSVVASGSGLVTSR